MSLGLFDLTGKTAIVTGSGRGLGRVLALGLAAAGARVVTCSRTVAEAEAVAGEIETAGGAAMAVRSDVSKRADCEALVGTAVERFGGLGEAAHADAVNPPRAVVAALDLGAERADRPRGAHHVVAFEEPGDLGFADRERAEHQRPVRDRLVAGHARLAAKRTGGVRCQFGGSGGQGWLGPSG